MVDRSGRLVRYVRGIVHCAMCIMCAIVNCVQHCTQLWKRLCYIETLCSIQVGSILIIYHHIDPQHCEIGESDAGDEDLQACPTLCRTPVTHIHSQPGNDAKMQNEY